MMGRCGSSGLLVLAFAQAAQAFSAPMMGAPRLGHHLRMTAMGSHDPAFSLPPALKLGSPALRAGVTGMPSSG